MTEATPANDSTAPQLTVNAQYVRDMSFENPNAPGIFLPGQDAPQLDVTVNVQAKPLTEIMHEVVLTLRAESKFGDKTGFIAELAYAGLFTTPVLPEQALRNLLLVECPRLLFPFARAIVSDMIRDGNFPPLLLAPVDFAALYRQSGEQQIA